MINLKNLSYSYQALEPYLDAKTVEIHHSKHHAKYVENANNILQKLDFNFQNMSLGQIIVNIKQVSEEYFQSLFNNVGQVFNHNLYWQSIGPEYPNSWERATILSKKILEKFQSLDNFHKLFKQKGLEQFGSGWVWLVVDQTGSLDLSKTSNADSPIFEGQKPILVMDVWEHAYYLKYQSQRAEYIDNFLKIIDWDKVQKLYEQSTVLNLVEFIDSI